MSERAIRAKAYVKWASRIRRAVKTDRKAYAETDLIAARFLEAEARRERRLPCPRRRAEGRRERATVALP